MSALPIEYYSYEDYKYWEGDWELIDGVAYAMTPSPIFSHQSIAYEVAFNFRDSLKNCKKCKVLGEIDYKVDEYTVLKPDVLIVCERFQSYITKAPKLIVEVISQSTARRDEKLKFEIYEKERVPYYILVYPEDKMVKVYKNSDDGYKKVLSDNDTYEFKIDDCKAKVDFKKVFERFM